MSGLCVVWEGTWVCVGMLAPVYVEVYIHALLCTVHMYLLSVNVCVCVLCTCILLVYIFNSMYRWHYLHVWLWWFYILWLCVEGCVGGMITWVNLNWFLSTYTTLVYMMNACSMNVCLYCAYIYICMHWYVEMCKCGMTLYEWIWYSY